MAEQTETVRKKRRTRAECEHARRLRAVRREFAQGRMPLLLRRYLADCGHDDTDVLSACECGGGDPTPKSDGRKRSSVSDARRLPNPAGFCRFLSLERDAYAALEREFPTEVGRMRAVFEDEALNSGLPASVLGLYLKGLLGAEEDPPSGAEESRGGGDILVTFAHDILSDGR